MDRRVNVNTALHARKLMHRKLRTGWRVTFVRVYQCVYEYDDAVLLDQFTDVH